MLREHGLQHKKNLKKKKINKNKGFSAVAIARDPFVDKRNH